MIGESKRPQSTSRALLFGELFENKYCIRKIFDVQKGEDLYER